MTLPAPLQRESRKRKSTVLHMAGLALLFVASGMAACVVVDLAVDGGETPALLASAAITGAVGFALWRLTRVGRNTPLEVFTAVAVSWLVMSLFGTLPYLLSGMIETFDDALFESVSGFSCTGSTILPSIEGNSRSILFWRQLTQWFGGMGVIVLAVAVLPFLGVGGLDLIKAEAPGPDTERLAPRIKGTAVRLWGLYVAFTIVGAISLMAAGASPYDGIAHSLTIVSTGGFSTFDDSIGGFDSQLIEGLVIIGMLIGGANFTLHWRFLRGDRSAYHRSSEFATYIGLTIIATVVIVVMLQADGTPLGNSLRGGTFTVTALITSTGFGNGAVGDFVLWPVATNVVLLGLMFVGGMSGSTAGGLKVIRFETGLRAARREVQRGLRPRAVLPLRLEGQSADETLVSRMLAFVWFYVLFIVGGTMLLVWLGSRFEESLGGAVSALGNMGPGLGETGPTSNFTEGFTRPARMWLAWLMLVGRLEIFPLMLMFTGAYRWGVRARRRVRRARAPVS